MSSLGSSAAKISIRDLRQIAQPRKKGYRRKMAVYSIQNQIHLSDHSLIIGSVPGVFIALLLSHIFLYWTAYIIGRSLKGWALIGYSVVKTSVCVCVCARVCVREPCNLRTKVVCMCVILPWNWGPRETEDLNEVPRKKMSYFVCSGDIYRSGNFL